MRRPFVYWPYADARYLVLVVVIAFVAALLLLNLAATAFLRIGFSWFEAMAILGLCLAGSGINLPLFRLRSAERVSEPRFVRYGPFLYRLPMDVVQRHETLIAINIGGGLVPAVVSVYLLLRFSEALPLALLTVLVVTLLVHRLAAPVENLGIVIAGFWPPLITVVTVLLLSSLLASSQESRFVAAYVGGTLGTLIGADLLNLRAIGRIGRMGGVGSIGGAGTFDGIFLAGVVAVLLT